MRPLVVALAVWVVAVSAAAAAPSDSGPWLGALSSQFVVVDLATGDLDGDGKDETVVCYREDVQRSADQVSGVVVYQGKGAELRPAFHVQLLSLCEKVRVNGRKLGILLGGKQLVWTYGDEIKFRKDAGSFWGGISAKASSTTGSGNGAEKSLDGDITTSWAEGAAGTGLGQTVTLRLPKTVDVGAIGIYCGNGSSPRAFFDNNRLHRGSVEAKTEADLGDTGAGLDFASLGIESMGDRVEFKCENAPGITYVPVNKKGVVELQVRIDSVYLGDKKDDTHVAEIEVVRLLALSDTLDKATAVKPKAEANGKSEAKPGVNGTAPGDKKSELPLIDEATKKLDEGGRSLVSDDEL